MKRKAVFYGLLMVLFLAYNVHANLVTNPGFETGDLTGWSVGGSGNPYAATYAQVIHSGSYGAYFEPYLASPGQDVNITQNVYLDGPGQYSFGGWLRYFTFDPVGNFDQGQVSVYAFFNGQSAVVGSSPNDTQPFVIAGSPFVINYKMSQDWFYFEGVLNYTGAAGLALLNISLQNSYNNIVSSLAVDDIFVNSVPEPATLLLLGAGLIGLAGYGRKKLN